MIGIGLHWVWLIPQYPRSELISINGNEAPKRLASLETNKIENEIDVSSDEITRNHGLVNLISIPGELLNQYRPF